MVSNQLLQFLKNKGLSTKDIQVAVGMVREVEEELRNTRGTLEAAKTALRQQASAVRSLADDLIERTRRKRELQNQITGDRAEELARSSQAQSDGVATRHSKI